MAKSRKKSTRRPNGEGTVYKMKDGRYGAAVSLGYDENGKRIRSIVTGKSEQIVKEKMENLLHSMQLIDDSHPIIVNGQSSVEDFIKEFEINGLLGKSDISTRTYENYEYCLNHFKNYFAGKVISTIDTDEINRFFRSMEKARKDNGEYKYSQVFLGRIKYLVDRMYKRAFKKGYISMNPLADEDFSAPKSKQEQHEVLALTAEEFDTLIKVLKSNKLIHPVIELMLNTGVRTQEALGLKWKHVDMENGIVYIRQAITINVQYDNNGNKIGRETVSSTTKKGSGDRDIYITDHMINVLKNWKTEAAEISKTCFGDEDYVFGNSRSNHWTYSGFRSSVNRYLESQLKDVDSLRLHRIRHTLATMLAEDGASVFELMQILGHTQTKTTMKYIDRASKKIAVSNRERVGRCLNERLV